MGIVGLFLVVLLLITPNCFADIGADAELLLSEGSHVPAGGSSRFLKAMNAAQLLKHLKTLKSQRQGVRNHYERSMYLLRL
ncbi:hypothetical protein QR680_015945 [Steinernema hermaphroditum]|uniref:Uncharacterized protein n=1 Tax=Steinernema hermaphroditum TaxID=289476 RepID=A0AA39LL34_9BILA|nr:hypothetical protein QR680_015945 [Steinernema hermaphroditum]